MNDLDELLKQRNEIDRKIKALQSQEREVDGARLFKKYGDSWAVTLQEIDDRHMINKKEWRYKQIVITKSRDETIEGLKTLIDTLTELYKKVTEEV